MSPAPPIIIMAGGDGARMGGNKPLQIVAGATMLARALAFARRHSPHVAIAARAAAQLGGLTDVRVLRDPMPGQGPVNALTSAFAFGAELGCPAVLVIGCDMPLLPDDLLGRLARNKGEHFAAIARSAGRLHPAAALWQVDRERLNHYIGSGRRALMGFAASMGYAAVDWALTPFDPFFNVNTPDDVVLVEAMLGARAPPSADKTQGL